MSEHLHPNPQFQPNGTATMMGPPVPPSAGMAPPPPPPPYQYNGPSTSSVNPYVHVSPGRGETTTETLWKVLGRAGKKLEVTTRKAAGVTGNVWTHLKAGNNLTDAAISRLSQETKVFAEGGHEKIFQQRFGIIPGEHLLKSYACYLSTSAGPVIGILYLSTSKLAFCSDNPLCHYPSPGQQEWIHYKVVVQLPQLRAVNPSANSTNPAEKYIQVMTFDGHEFWFMGFVNYDKAYKNLVEALQRRPVYY